MIFFLYQLPKESWAIPYADDFCHKPLIPSGTIFILNWKYEKYSQIKWPNFVLKIFN